MRRWQVAAGLIYGQVKKCYRRRRLVRVSQVLRLGTKDALQATLQELGLSGRLNTAFIERVNLTIRQAVAALARRTWATAQQSPLCWLLRTSVCTIGRLPVWDPSLILSLPIKHMPLLQMRRRFLARKDEVPMHAKRTEQRALSVLWFRLSVMAGKRTQVGGLILEPQCCTWRQ